MKLLLENWRKYLKEAMSTAPPERNLPEPPWGPYTQERDVVNVYNEQNAHRAYHELDKEYVVGWPDNVNKFQFGEVMKKAAPQIHQSRKDHKAKREELKNSLSAASDKDVEDTNIEVVHVDEDLAPIADPAYTMTIGEITAPGREEWAKRNSPLMTGREGRVYTPTAKEWYLGIDAEGNPSTPKEWVANTAQTDTDEWQAPDLPLGAFDR